MVPLAIASIIAGTGGGGGNDPFLMNSITSAVSGSVTFKVPFALC